VIALAIAAHGVGHSVGFGVAAPLWFAAAWLLPGAGFVIAAWAVWTHRTWWEPVVFGSALASLALEAVAGVSLQPGPYASAAVFNALAIILLLVPRMRHFANLIGIVIAALVVAALTSTSVPLLGSQRAIFVAAVLLGVSMCSLGGVGRAPMMATERSSG
jgi:hypothetical protein